MAEPVNFCLEEDEHIAIIGRNGAGKTMFVDMLTGKHPAFPDMVRYGFDEPYNKLRYISFRDTYGGDNDRTYFLQQRWNQMEIDEETPTVGSKLEEAYQLAGDDTPERRALQKHIYEIFHLEPLLDKYIILLSSGELRKYKLASSLFTNPKVLIMENPFIGLDKETREQLKELLGMLAQEQGLQIILVLAKTDEIPEFITHIVEVKDLRVMPKVNSGQWRVESGEFLRPSGSKNSTLYTLNSNLPIIHFNHVTIRYGARTILKDLDWTVMQGEHWALSGQNGSGKSTLLSLVCADNPQSYACDISLFGHKRGSGESIWDIKRHIGYVSPEMHRSYKQNIPSIEIVASGLKDTIGLYTRPKEDEKIQCRKWLNVFGIGNLEDRKFHEMSSGEQRLVLLARAFVKEPDLLILDEPLHGLDDINRKMVKDIVDDYCKNPEVTLIYVTHYQEELPKCIDHSIYLHKN
ncbi:MAG: ATP-binding cassette domain-containing protein [Prevotella sp.]|nr:ATP-binding cassette domain-containing protein [Prevotella sp.]MBR1768242.1 ATP-binding cassette domain-containing protein [Prevotella sp.]